tara:strand:+ start:118 stop:888 length:771 start_codon:yes stop_codon:yes gene_type:complete
MEDLTLFQFACLLLLASLMVRVSMAILPVFRFRSLFEKGESARHGAGLVRDLGIPGFDSFIKQEFTFGLAPYLSTCVVMFLFDLDTITLQSLSRASLIVTALGLIVWLIIDWLRSYTVYQQLNAIYLETKKLKEISGSVLDGLKYIVYLRPSVGKTAWLLGKRAAVGVAKKKIDDKEAASGKKSLASVAFMAVESLISFPERVIGKLTDWAKGSIEETLKGMLAHYTERPAMQNGLLFLWSLVPAIWLAIIATMYG